MSEEKLFSRFLEGLISVSTKTVGERFRVKSYCPVNLLSVLWLVTFYEKIVNNRLADHCEKMWPFFSDFQYGFRFSHLTADLLTVEYDRITRVFNESIATWAVTVDMFKALAVFVSLVFFTKSSSMDFQVGHFWALFHYFTVWIAARRSG